MVKASIIFFILLSTLLSNPFYYKNGQRINLWYQSETDSANIDFYQTQVGLILGVTDKLLVKLKDTTITIDPVLNEFNLTLVKQLSNNLYLLKTEDKSLTLDIANELHLKDEVEYAHPDFIKKRIRR